MSPSFSIQHYKPVGKSIVSHITSSWFEPGPCTYAHTQHQCSTFAAAVVGAAGAHQVCFSTKVTMEEQRGQSWASGSKESRQDLAMQCKWEVQSCQWVSNPLSFLPFYALQSTLYVVMWPPGAQCMCGTSGLPSGWWLPHEHPTIWFTDNLTDKLTDNGLHVWGSQILNILNAFPTCTKSLSQFKYLEEFLFITYFNCAWGVEHKYWFEFAEVSSSRKALQMTLVWSNIWSLWRQKWATHNWTTHLAQVSPSNSN